MGLVRRLAAVISRLLETHFLTLFHAASALSAPSGHLPLEGKAIHIKRRGRHHHFSFLISHESRDEQLVTGDW